jgi:hypothetical protein
LAIGPFAAKFALREMPRNSAKTLNYAIFNGPYRSQDTFPCFQQFREMLAGRLALRPNIEASVYT